jgi:hypothetical protein
MNNLNYFFKEAFTPAIVDYIMPMSLGKDMKIYTEIAFPSDLASAFKSAFIETQFFQLKIPFTARLSCATGYSVESRDQCYKTFYGRILSCY